MTFEWYRGDGTRPDIPVNVPPSRHERLAAPQHYLADVGLRDACNVALALGQPLLLTGEPGTGKTRFANSLAWELGLGDPLLFETKSTSSYRDLFYTYDALKRFHDVQSGHASESALPYLTYRALGMAILRTNSPASVVHLLPPGMQHDQPCRSVVLIDEIDKAPRDFPNDILNELERLYFRVPELDNAVIKAAEDLHPIVIMTSNSEKDLPDAFLRRCIYYNIPFPSRERLQKIVAARLGNLVEGISDFVDDAIELFTELRLPARGLRKKPATAELLGWLITLRGMSPDSDNPLREPGLALRTLSTLVKTADDQQKAARVVEQWLGG